MNQTPQNKAYQPRRMRSSQSPSQTGIHTGTVGHRTVRAQQRSAKKHQGGGSKILVYLIALVILAGIGVATFALSNLFSESTQEISTDGSVVEVVFAEGSSAGQFGEELYQAKLISKKSEFMDEIEKQKAALKLKPGSYVFKNGMSVQDIVSQLIQGPNAIKHKVTIPEGSTIKQTADQVEKALGIPVNEFMARAKADLFVQKFLFLKEAKENSLEGFLYPKTYSFDQQPTADDVIAQMLEQYNKEVVQTLSFAEGKKHIEAEYGIVMSDYDFVILASIIEKEVNKPEQMPLVASVFYNRLKKDMPLQSDATLAAALGKAISAQDLTQNHPYNTYTNKGLTPTPVCSPSAECIRAALNPTKTNKFFFWIDPQEAYFSETLEEHNAVIEKRKDYAG